jgi:hypothetical protein
MYHALARPNPQSVVVSDADLPAHKTHLGLGLSPINTAYNRDMQPNLVSLGSQKMPLILGQN